MNNNPNKEVISRNKSVEKNDRHSLRNTKLNQGKPTNQEKENKQIESTLSLLNNCAKEMIEESKSNSLLT
jgi:hypothetical protein